MTGLVAERLNALSQRWGNVYVCIRSDPFHDEDKDRVCVRNHTDEGLGNGEKKAAYGETLEEAVNSAMEGDYRSPWDQ